MDRLHTGDGSVAAPDHLTLKISAMSLAMPDTEHPNRLPFSGILTRIGTPSDAAPHGSGGRRIVVTAAAAEHALPSLLGMAVNLTADLEGHDAQAKVGLITDATIKGDAIHIEGFVYAVDFPKVAQRIQADKDLLGFSFEAVEIGVADPSASVVEVTALTFTGAAILLKDKAAYTTTSLSAAADLELEMKPEDLKAMLEGTMAAALEPITTRLDKIESANAERLSASQSTMDAVEPHAAGLDALADAMEAAGIGCAADNGHVGVLRKMASTMRASAALGKLPSSFNDYYYASGEVVAPLAPLDPVALAAAVDKALADKLGDGGSVAAFHAAAAPARKTVSPSIITLLARAGIGAPSEGAHLDVSALDEALSKSGMKPDERIKLKASLRQSGMLA